MMPGDGAIIFGDLIGKVGLIRVDCHKYGRRGRSKLARLIGMYGRDAKALTWLDHIIDDCPRKKHRSDSDPCGAIFYLQKEGRAELFERGD